MARLVMRIAASTWAMQASAACALLCAAPALAQQPAAAFAGDPAARSFALGGPALAFDAPLLDASPLGAVTGEGWRAESLRLGVGGNLSIATRDRAAAMLRPGGALPSDVFLLSDPQLAGMRDGEDVRLDVWARVFDTRAGAFDFDLGPRAGLMSSPGERAASAGIVARIGRNLDETDSGRRTWFLFAGYGRKAVTIGPAGGRLGFSDPQVERQAILGDAQAGLAFDLGGGADLTLSYTRQERSFAKHGWGEGRHDGFAVISLNILN